MPQSLLYVQKQNEIILAIVALLLDRRSKKSIQRNSSVISLVVGNPIDHFFAQKNSDSISGAFGSQSPTTTGATVSFRTSGDMRHQKKNIQIFSIVNPPRPNSSNKSFVPRFWITFWRRRENPQAIVHSTRTHSGKWTTYLFAICSFLKRFFIWSHSSVEILAKFNLEIFNSEAKDKLKKFMWGYSVSLLIMWCRESNFYRPSLPYPWCARRVTPPQAVLLPRRFPELNSNWVAHPYYSSPVNYHL